MAAGSWLLALAWTCLAGCLCNGLEDSFRETDDDHLEYKFDNNYIAMKEAAHGINIPNPDVIMLYGMEAASLYYASTHRLAYLCYRNTPSNSRKIFVAVVNGVCVPSPSRDHHGCLTEREARTEMLKEVRLELYTAAARITEAGVRTRLQWFQENGVDDVVSTLSADVQNFIHDLVSVFQSPVQSLLKAYEKFDNILVDRYTSGTGSANEMMWAADALHNKTNVIIDAIIRIQDPAFKLYHSILERMELYRIMFQDHLKAVLYMPLQEIHIDSPYPTINQYWDARALEYAITWIFKIRNEVGELEKKEFDKVLEDCYTKLVVGEMEECLAFADRLLSKAMDRLGHRMFSKYLEQPLHDEMERLSLPMPPNLEDLNPFGVPRSLSEAEMSSTENFIHQYLDEAEEGGVGRLLFSQLVSWM